MNLEVPVLFIVFNRPDFVKLSFERIKEQRPKHLYIAADGPREGNQKDQTNCKKVRDFINENTNWDVEIHYLYRDKNLGCGKAVS
ncbi:MAG: hypothetical protein V2I33_19655, partial [Kangiellaceae bacterium]|nr:hypothetical protein [Kangiellaceae bacterium]